ncbi:MAG: hypothetical protein KC729_15185, partial [Candidatus Eisenbacteria bacterium]|nr:hypothetical protein [Candidatus Eisenbacteria bacterium]
ALPLIDPEVRASVERFTRDHGVAASYERLRELDPSGAAGVPERNRQRVMRALELVTQAGRPLADLFRGEREGRVHPPIPSFVLQRERADLYARIDRRCEQMLADGLLEETRRLLERGLAADAPGMRTLGYREMAEHLRGETTWDEARDRFLRHSRQYGKRQETWFRHRLAGAVTIAVSAEDPPESVAGRILSLVADAGS